ncbi:hypothetical protein HMPREF9397_1730 [Streptococcus sanguinis SK1087]|uniref:Type II secretion system protein n=2 Tax=Streptococcus sanguinis TaxID=1305 RepID=F3SKT7_STRSA|nr:type II secretion system protein [Streptococcus sanguinis]EGG39252.1 hypothetical protein HMPREF9397_1730 [Streptococcus sanguinis SK1087]
MKQHFLQKRRGVTLVEVLISLIILSVVTVSLLAFFSTGYQSIMRQRGQNIENFDAQESFEKRLSQIKREGGHGTETENFVYRKGNEASRSIPVKGQTLSYDDKKKVLRLFVANAKESVLDIPTDLSVRLKDSKGFYYVGEDAPEGEASLNQGQQNNKSKIHLESGWFEGDRNIEKDGERLVPIGTPGNRIASNNSRIVFPSMPGDFTLKPNLSNRKFTITDSMRGKYLTYAARAINSFGRVGEYQEAEKRIWVMGLPVTNNLEVHTDADLILQKNGDGSKSLLPSDGVSHTDTDIQNHAKPNQPYVGIYPVLSYYEEAIKQPRQFIALSDKPNDKKEMGFTRDFSNGLTTSILLGNRQQSGKILTYQLDNTLSWGINLEADGRLDFIKTDKSVDNSGGQQPSSVRIDYNKDNSIQVRSAVVNNTSLVIEVFVNGELVHTENIRLSSTQVTHNFSSGKVIFSGNTYINEFAIYTTALRDPDINKLAEYFRDKYKAS